VTAPTRPPHVDVFVDPVCPFAWIAYRWLLEVGEQRDLDLHLRMMSLAVLNGEDPEHPERGLESAWRPVRVGAAMVERTDERAWAQFVVAFGTRYHVRGERNRDDVLRATLADLGAEEFYAAADSTERDEEIRRRHDEGMAPVGLDVGTPVLHVDGTAFFGPVLEAVPRGQEALDAFDGALLLARNPHFVELKRTRSGNVDPS
jgi:hypothetical protein